jgi:hypothetical protein
LIAADDAVCEGEVIWRTGRLQSDWRAKGCLRGRVKVLAQFEWALGNLSERCGSRRRTSEGSERIYVLVTLS